MKEVITCTPKLLPREVWLNAALTATEINPANRPMVERIAFANDAAAAMLPSPELIAVMTSKYWQSGGVNLTVSFLDNPSSALRARILSHMNAWAKSANVRFSETKSQAEVRIARVSGGGHWSYLGTDVLHIPTGQPTMNLDAFTMETPDAEFFRVVRHETGHTMGFPHEHMRRELVQRIDQAKAIAFFMATQGWSEDMVRRQVLTPLEESSILGTPQADALSIMCYQIPGTITKTGKPIMGGADINATDHAFAGKIYPKSKTKKAPITNRKTVAKGRARRRKPGTRASKK